MSNSNFAEFLHANTAIDSEVINRLVSQCRIRHVKKGDFLLRQGEKCKYSFFVEKGLLRQYSIDEKGKEHIIQFAPENWFMSDRESVYFDQPSAYFVQALEDTDVALMDETLIIDLSKSDVKFLEYHNRLLHNHIRHLQKRITLLQSASAEERYLAFVKIYPDLLLRVPQILIASYLGITPESLSRVRRDLAHKNQKR